MSSLEFDWNTYLKPLGVSFNFKTSSWHFKTLMFLYEHIGEWMSKEQIEVGIGYDGRDLQSPRHLAKQYGWNIDQDRKGNYRLLTTKEPHPSFVAKKRLNELNTSDFTEIKTAYNNKCATCGEKEGSRHRFEHGKVVLEKGHMDPRMDMSPENIIPQCNFCNKFYGDKFVFDRFGRVVESLRSDV